MSSFFTERERERERDNACYFTTLQHHPPATHFPSLTLHPLTALTKFIPRGLKTFSSSSYLSFSLLFLFFSFVLLLLVHCAHRTLFSFLPSQQHFNSIILILFKKSFVETTLTVISVSFNLIKIIINIAKSTISSPKER